MMITPQNLRGIYVGFNTIFNKALGDYKPLYPEIATVTPSTTDIYSGRLGILPRQRGRADCRRQDCRRGP